METEEIKKILKNHEKRIGILEGDKKIGHGNVEKLTRQESLREFINKYKFKAGTDKVLLMIYFLETRRSVGKVSIKELSECFKEIRDVVPRNMSDKFYKLAKRGFIMPADSNSNGKVNFWRYTNTGKGYIEKKLKNAK